MPVEFLTNEKAAAYGRFPSSITTAQLNEYFHFAADSDAIGERRGDHNRLGFALQLGTVRFLGTFLADPTETPIEVLDHVAAQLGVADPSIVKLYRDSETRWDHQGEIRDRYGYVVFGRGMPHLAFLRWLYARAWLSDERPTLLFDRATAYLVDHRILLPGVTVLARLVASIRDRARQRLWRQLGACVDDEMYGRLEQLLVVDEERQSRFDRLRTAPSRPSGTGLIDALERLEEIRRLGSEHLDVSGLPAAAVRQLARHAFGAKAQTVDRMAPQRRRATLVAFTATLAIDALDDVLDVFDTLIGELRLKAEYQARQTRLRTIGEYDQAATDLRGVANVILAALDDPAIDIREAVLAQVSRDRLETAVNAVERMAREPGDRYHTELLTRYATVRRFLPRLLAAIDFDGTPAAQPILDAVDHLRHAETHRRRTFRRVDTPTDAVSTAWQVHVFPDSDTVDRRAYTLAVVEALRDGLRRHDIFIDGSRRWSDPRSQLIESEHWASHRHDICAALGHDPRPDIELAALCGRLDTSYRTVADGLDENAALRLDHDGGGVTVTPLEAIQEPESLVRLRAAVEALLPEVELPEVILEVDAWTRFSDEFTHAGGSQSRMDDLPISICAVLVAQACNIGFRPLIDPDVPALTRERLSFVGANYLRADTLAAANARLVDHHNSLNLAEIWGGGEVASVDGLRFVVPVRTINAGFNRRYFPARGVTWLNYMTDHFTGFHQLVVPGTLRDSLYILEGLLDNDTSVEPREIMSDTAGASDIIFGLFWLLGYQFSPRLADIGEARFWRTDPAADYGPLNQLARHRINTDRIAQHWDDLLRIAGSLKQGTVRASNLIRTLGGSATTSTGNALRDLGRIVKTLYQLGYVDDPDYRRRIHTQLNRHESRHALARAVFHGDRGQLRQRYREGQEDQLSALGLVVNILALWNTVYTQAAIDHLRQAGHKISHADVERLSPLGRDHINLRGRYNITTNSRSGRLRPLRA